MPIYDDPNSILLPQDIEHLQDEGYVRIDKPDRIRIQKGVVKTRFATTSTPEQSYDLDEDEKTFIEIPRDFISRFTIRFLGFSVKASDEIWDRWQNRAEDHKLPRDLGFAQFVLYDLSRQQRVTTSMFASLLQYEMAVYRFDLYGYPFKTMVDPQFKQMCKSLTASQWVRNTVEDGFLFLRSGREASRARQRDRERVGAR